MKMYVESILIISWNDNKQTKPSKTWSHAILNHAMHFNQTFIKNDYNLTPLILA